MKNKGIQILTAGIIAFSSVFVTSVVVTNHIEAATEIGCRCGLPSCDGSCGIKNLFRRRAVCCPSCDAEICELKTEETKEKKTCYKVEQKTVCIPAVRLPWQACAPATSSSRKVNVLKKHTYECPTCSYSWSVVKPEVKKTAPPIQAPTEPVINSGAWNAPRFNVQPVGHDASKHPWSVYRTPAENQTNGSAIDSNSFFDNISILKRNR